VRKTKLTLCLLAAACFFALAVRATTWNRTCSVTGGSAQRLSTVLTTCGFAGTLALKELTVKNPDAATYDLYVGSSDVDATNGYKLSPGDSKTWRSSGGTDVVEPSQMYLYQTTTESKSFSARAQ
jgi:hypothetical protein